MGDVVPFKKSNIKKAYEDDYDFLFCFCQSDKAEPEQTFHPMTCSDINGPILVGMFCDCCNKVLTIENGRLGHFIDENA